MMARAFERPRVHLVYNEMSQADNRKDVDSSDSDQALGSNFTILSVQRTHLPKNTLTKGWMRSKCAGIGPPLPMLRLQSSAIIDISRSSSVLRDPLVQSASSGSLRLAGQGGQINLSGTYEDSTREVTLSGGGYRFTGRVEANGLEVSGFYSGPGGSTGPFGMLNTGDGGVTNYCGTFTGVGGGRVALSISGGNTVAGGWFNNGNRSNGNIHGQRSGNSLDLTCDPDIGIRGTQSGDALDGTWGEGADGGTWQASTTGCERAMATPGPVVLFDNGSSSGPQRNLRNDAGFQEVFEDFRLTQDAVITAINWQQHVHNQSAYQNTHVIIFSGLPRNSAPLFNVTFVAERTRNSTPTLFNAWEGFDFVINDLSIALAPGTYWIGLNNNESGNTSGWDNTPGGPHTISGSRVINENNPVPGSTVTDNLAFTLRGRRQ